VRALVSTHNDDTKAIDMFCRLLSLLLSCSCVSSFTRQSAVIGGVSFQHDDEQEFALYLLTTIVCLHIFYLEFWKLVR